MTGLAELQVEPQVERPQMGATGKGRTGIRRWVRRGLVAVIALLALPLALTLLYLPSFVHPVSMLMVRDTFVLKDYERRWVPLGDIAPVLMHSVIMSEDGQFCRHRGVDLGELKGVVQDALAGEATRGASTIPMQTVKNLFLWNDRSFLRKAMEIPYAVYLDAVMSKKRILEIYLNIAEWGPGLYGIEAAAQHHFGKAAKNLTLPNPAVRDPARPSAELKRLAARIERRAAQAGDYVTCLQ